MPPQVTADSLDNFRYEFCRGAILAGNARHDGRNGEDPGQCRQSVDTLFEPIQGNGLGQLDDSILKIDEQDDRIIRINP